MRKIFLVILSVVILRIHAMDFFMNQNISKITLGLAKEGRAFFEGYPEVQLISPYRLTSDEVFEDKVFLQSFPKNLSSEEIVLMHRENVYKEHRFLDILNLRYNDCPKTLGLFSLLKNIVYAPVLYLKLVYNRPRPSELIGQAAVILDTPDTPSYPSLAATEATLIASVFSDFFEDLKVKEKILQLGESMGTRRVLAGVSFPSDVKAGQALANQLKVALLKEPHLQEQVQLAMEEIKSHIKNLGALSKFQAIDFGGMNDEILTFQETPLKDFVNKLSLISSRKIVLDVQTPYRVNETFRLQEWPIVLEAVVLDAGLKQENTAKEIIIFKD